MVWGRVDDKYHGHRKVVDLSTEPVRVPLMLAAVGLNTLAWSWCNDQLTDGHMPRALPAKLAGAPVDNLIAELVRVGLWERSAQGYRIHDFLDYNPSRAEVLAKRTSKAEAGRKGGQRSVETRRDRYGTAQPQRLSDVFASLASEADAEARIEAVASTGASSGSPGFREGSVEANSEAAPKQVLSKHPKQPRTPYPSSIEDIEATTPVDNSCPEEGPADDFRDIDFGDERP